MIGFVIGNSLPLKRYDIKGFSSPRLLTWYKWKWYICHMDKISDFLDSQMFWGIVGVIITAITTAIALSGRLSVSFSRGLLVFAWLIAIIGFYRLAVVLNVHWILRSLLTMLCASVLGIGLYYLGQWFDVTEIKPPETINATQSFGQVHEYLGKDADVKLAHPLLAGALTSTTYRSKRFISGDGESHLTHDAILCCVSFHKEYRWYFARLKIE